MELKEIVAFYADKTEKGKEIDLKNLSKDELFRSQVIKAVLEQIKGKPQACVLIPAYRSNNTHLGKLINELALTLQVRTLVTGEVENIKHLHHSNIKEVVLIKQSFRVGHELAKQIAAIKAYGCKVSVLCLISHSRERLEQFAKENEVEIVALVSTDEF